MHERLECSVIACPSKAFIEKRNRHDGSINLILKQLNRVKDSFS
jgi:hypothetical protein